MYRFDGTILDMNEAALDILGLRHRFPSPGDVTGQNVESLIVYVGPRHRVRDLIRRYGGARNVLYPFRTLDGVEKWVVHDSFAVVDPATGEEVVQAIIKDVTEIHQAEEALRAREERLAGMIETLTEGIVIRDLDGRFSFANPAAERILGLSGSDGGRRTYNDPGWKTTTVEGHPMPEQELPFARVKGTGRPANNVELAVEHPDGTRAVLMVNGAPLRDAAGAMEGVVLSFTDVTEQRQLEMLRDEFISAAAHELKTPVTTIKGYAQLLRKWTPGHLSPREGQALELINVQCDRISRRLQEMLEVVRFRTLGPAMHVTPFDLKELVSQVVQRVQATTQLHRLKLKQATSAPVDADRERMEEVVANLLDNAIKFSPGGGEIDIRVRTRDGKALVSVRDHGVGISKERQGHLFEPFYEPVPPGEPGYRSVVALGLYLSRLTLERHQGEIWCESEGGKGSTFYFSLPLAAD